MVDAGDYYGVTSLVAATTSNPNFNGLQIFSILPFHDCNNVCEVLKSLSYNSKVVCRLTTPPIIIRPFLNRNGNNIFKHADK
jgi:hypothetical protein